MQVVNFAKKIIFYVDSFHGFEAYTVNWIWYDEVRNLVVDLYELTKAKLRVQMDRLEWRICLSPVRLNDYV